MVFVVVVIVVTFIVVVERVYVTAAVVVDPRKLPLKFCQRQVSNSWDIADIGLEMLTHLKMLM